MLRKSTTAYRLFERVLTLLAMPLALLALAVKPWRLVRFGAIQPARLGHVSLEPELYLCRRALGLDIPDTIDFFYYDKLPDRDEIIFCNSAIREILEAQLRVHSLARYVYAALALLGKAREHEVAFPGTHVDEKNQWLAKVAPRLPLTDRINRAGRDFLESLGVAERPFVCVHCRDSKYLDQTMPGRDWSYHDYRDSRISSFEPAMLRLAEKGYAVFRMGALVSSPISISHPLVFDYAVNLRREELDFFLLANCAFYVGASSGPCSLPPAYRRPYIVTNFIPLEYAPGMPYFAMVVPRLLVREEDETILSLEEVFRTGLIRGFLSQDYQRNKVRTIENTAEDVIDAALEMHERISGKWVAHPDDEALKERFWSYFDHSRLNGYQPMVSSRFLRKYPEFVRV